MTKAIPTRHGFKSVKARVLVQGLSVIDKRSLAARALLEWKERLIRDLGGEKAISTQKETLIELVVRTRLLVEHLDNFILGCPSLVNKKRRSIYPIVRERQHLVDSLARMLGQLGLAKLPTEMGDLREYLKEVDCEHPAGDAGPKVICEDIRAEEGSAESEAGA
jgi:hypothetical protein